MQTTWQVRALLLLLLLTWVWMGILLVPEIQDSLLRVVDAVSWWPSFVIHTICG